MQDLSTPGGRIAFALLAVGVLELAIAQPQSKPRREITLTAQSVPLSSANPNLDQVGALHFLGGVALSSEDKGFGGLSGLVAENSKEGLQIIAVSDEGNRFSAHVAFENGRLRGVDAATLEPLLNEKGRAVSGKAYGDSESVTRLKDGRILVGFERNHRIWSYGPQLTGTATAFETPPGLDKAPSNGGLESIANWPDGRILAITEQMKATGGNNAAFLWSEGKWTTLEWKPSSPGFEPSDATVLADGDLLVLERYWSALAPLSLSSRIMRVKGGTVKPGAVLQGELVAELKMPLIVENFEGITSFTNASGKTELLLVSDDNFNGAQRTLLLSFEIRE